MKHKLKPRPHVVIYLGEPLLHRVSRTCSVRTQDARKPFVAYFGGAGTLGRPRMHAWMSRSTHGLRERLQAEPHGLVFTAPLAPGADVTSRDGRMQAELKEASQMVNCSNAMHHCKTTSSMCLVLLLLWPWHMGSSYGDHPKRACTLHKFKVTCPATCVDYTYKPCISTYCTQEVRRQLCQCSSPNTTQRSGRLTCEVRSCSHGRQAQPGAQMTRLLRCCILTAAHRRMACLTS